MRRNASKSIFGPIRQRTGKKSNARRKSFLFISCIFFLVYLNHRNKSQNATPSFKQQLNVSNHATIEHASEPEIVLKYETDGNITGCSAFIESERGTELPETMELETEDMIQTHSLYPLCQPHTIVASREDYNKVLSSRNSISILNLKPYPELLTLRPSSLPSVPFIQKRYIAMYGHWRLALSKLRARLAKAGEAPYIQSASASSQTPFLKSSPFSDLISRFPLSPRPKPVSVNQSQQHWSSSTWANEPSSLDGFCGFIRTIAGPPSGPNLPPLFPSPPSLLLYSGALLYFKMTGQAGSPQGDLMQWADVLIALHILGLGPMVSFHTNPGTCPKLGTFDGIWGDYLGLTHNYCGFRESLQKQGSFALRCRVRVLDLFGTQGDFNCASLGSPSSSLCLPSLRQFLTLQPEFSSDNTFLGFVSPLPSVPARFWLPETSRKVCPFPHPLRRQWRALVWAKGATFFSPKYSQANFNPQAYLLQLAERVPLVATAVADERSFIEDLLRGRINVTGRILSPTETSALMSQCAVVIGLGVPLMASGLIEAVASVGLRLLNPRFFPAWDRANCRAMAAKPTNQGMPSQQPFLESAFGPPFVYNVNPVDPNEVERSIVFARADFERLQRMSAAEIAAEFKGRRRAVLERVEPFYGAEGFILRVKNVLDSHGSCFGVDEKEWISRLASSFRKP